MVVDTTKAWDIVVVGSVNTDYLGRGGSLPRPGETMEAEEFLESPGGKGANQAVAAARLGARVALVACVGQDARGDSLMAHLKNEGVALHHVMRDASAPTGITLVQVDAQGRKQIQYVPGANHRLSVTHIHKATELLMNSRVVLTQLEIPLECAAAAIHLAHQAGARVVLDPAPAAVLPEGLLRRVDVIKPNAGEAQTLVHLRVDDRPSARAAAARLLGSGVGAASVQAGPEGDLLVWPDGECWLPRLPVTSVDTTGAGDAFAAALAVALAEGRSWDEAGRFASAAAALSTMALGAQTALPQRDEVEALLAANAETEEERERVPAVV